jgi:hypothetical protein
MEMDNLTQEQFCSLPVLKATSHIDDIIALYVHQRLPHRPATIVTEKGHFRLPTRLYGAAYQAYHALAGKAEEYEGPRQGALAEVLRNMAGNADEDGARADEREPLRRLAEGLAQEAFTELGGMLADQVARLYQERKGALVAAAVRALGELA